MSDEASSSAAAYSASVENDGLRSSAATRARVHAERRKENRNNFNRKRGELLLDLVQNLDILVYAELSTIYYMDCSFTKFLMRALVQFIFLTPKPSGFPEPPANRPYIGGIIGTNLLCLLLHILYAPPSAGEAARGYLHGGIVMDLIGQKGPASTWLLLSLDLLVTALQLLHLSAHIARERLKSSTTSITASTGRASTPAAPPTQDLDSEERGVRRSDEQQDVEMHSLSPSGLAIAPTTSSTNTEDAAERETLLADHDLAPPSDAHIFDAFNSGQIVLADLDVLRTVREQFWAYQSAPAEGLQTGREMRANLTGQLLRWRFGARAGGGPAVRRV